MQPDYLSQLQDIQLPESIGWWPLAWGWWVMFALIITTVVILVLLVQRYIQNRKAKNAALKLLNQVALESSALQQVKQINQLLKRVVLAYVKRNEVAELSGTEWANWLNQFAISQGKSNIQIDANFVSLAYSPNCTEQQAEQYLQQATLWVSKVLPPKNINKLSGGQHV